MRIKKVLSAVALTALLAIPIIGTTNKSLTVHADYIPVKKNSLVSLPKPYYGTWGAQRSYGPIGTGSWKNPVAAKFYRKIGYIDERGTNTRHAFKKDNDFKGYDNLFMHKHKWTIMQGGNGISLSRNHHTMYYYDGGTEYSPLHRISNRTYNSMLKQMQPKKRRWRRIRYYRTGYSDHYGHWHAYRVHRSYKRRKRQARKSVNKPVRHRHTNSTAQNLAEMKSQTLTDINNDRAAYHENPLQEDSGLDQIASIRAKQSQTNFNHYDPNNGGRMYEAEVADETGHSLDNTAYAENLGQTSLGNWYNEDTNDAGQTKSYDCHNGNDMANANDDSMMNYDHDSGWAHRNNILGNYNWIGVGTSKDSQGNYYLAEDFAQ